MCRTPVDAAAFAEIAELYKYDPDLPLDGVTIESWTARIPYTIDKVMYDSTHNERVPGYFAHSPKDQPGPRPTVLLVHGANSFWGRHEDWALEWLDILARAGYCVLCIDNADHGERMTRPTTIEPGSYRHREWLVQTVVDQRRGVEYLLTRPEVDASRIALLGGSLGGWIGCLVAGLESRFAAIVLTVVGAWVEGPTDDPQTRWINMLNFAPRFSAPALMVNATGDRRALDEELFAAMPEPKQQVWVESSHYLPPRQNNADILAWLGEKH